MSNQTGEAKDPDEYLVKRLAGMRRHSLDDVAREECNSCLFSLASLIVLSR